MLPIGWGMALRRSLLLVLLLSLAPPATASAALPPTTPELISAAEERGDISSDRANLYLAYAFGDPASLPTAYRSNSPWDGTLVLRELQADVRKMPRGRARERIEDEISAQHTGATCSSSTDNLPNSVDTTRFHIDYDTIGGGLTIAEYQKSLETTWGTEVNSYGWAAPPVLASNPPPGGRYHVRVDMLAGGLYGFVSSSGTHAGLVGDNPNTPAWNEGDALASCMVLNRDFSPFPGTSQQALDATAAHEFNHSIQYGYGATLGANVPDDVFFEGGATWMEDEVFDASNDNYNYLWPAFEDSMGEYDSSPYEYWITFRALTERYGLGVPGGGEQVMQEFWEVTSRNTASNLTAMNAALLTKGTTLADAFHAYAVAVKFNKGCTSGYVVPYCFEEGPAYVTAAGATPVDGTVASVPASATASIEDNYALGWIALPTTGTYDVLLENLSATGGSMRGTVACDNGSSLTLLALPSVVGPSGSSRLVNFSPAGCTSPLAVVSNESQTAADPSSSTSRQFRVSALTPTGTDKPLSVTRAGSGNGTVTSSTAGIDCGSDCAEQYANGASVTLTAAPAAGSTFGGWVGACSGTATCQLTMSAASSVTAIFSTLPVDPGGNNPGPGGGGGSGGVVQPPPPPPDVLAPALTRLRLSVSAFRAARFGPSIASPVGTRVSFRLSEQARVTFRVRRKNIGRRVAGRCRATTRLNRNRPRCVRWVRVRGSFAVTRRAGARSFVFRGRIGGRRLRLGVYRLAGRARDDAGNASPVKRVSFRVVRR